MIEHMHVMGPNIIKLMLQKKRKKDKYKKPCYLCCRPTVWMCMGCHRPCCEVNENEEVMQKLITDDAKYVALLNVEPPATLFRTVVL